MGNTLWGATPEEWALWRSLCPEHLLPTVCNPEAAVSKKSQLYRIDKTTGQLLHPAKVPSLYNRKKEIAGIRQWAQLLITPAMLDSWQQVPDYGICVRTGRGLLALDCDSENEGHHAIIEQVLRDTLGCLPPCRFRENANKCLYLLNAPFERRKSVLRLPDEDGRPAQIELLATGQQFMAAGIHPSGARIVWRCEGELCPVDVSEEQLEAIETRLRALLPVVNAQISTSEKSSDDVADLEREVMLARVDEQTFEDLRSALWYAPVLEMAGPYSSWIDMGNRLAWFKGTEYEEQARELWLEWSATAPDGDIEAAAAKWDNDAIKADRTGYPSVFIVASHVGWINPGAERLRSPVAVAEDFEDLTKRKDKTKTFADIHTDMTSHFLQRFIYVVDGDKVCDLSRPPYSCTMEMKAFKNLMAPYQFPPVGKGNPTPATKKWIEHPKKQVAESLGYQPGVGRLITRADGRYEINEFYMPQHPKTSDTRKVTTFLDHMTYLVPDKWQREFFIARLAWFVQRPDRRCPISILHVATAHGTGRGWVSQLMEKVLGPWNCARTRMKILCDNQFHDYLYHTLLCTIDEVRENDRRYEVNDKIRDVLTEPRFEVNRKYGKKMTIDIFTGFLFYTNHYDALALPEEDRRIAVLGGPDSAASEEHYGQLYAALSDGDFIAQVYWYLMDSDISRFNWQRAPLTEERQLMIESNKSDVETAVIAVLENPPVLAMTYQQIVNGVIKAVGFDVEISHKHITRLLRERTKRPTVSVKIDGVPQRFWILEKNSEFSNEELREMFKKCEKLQTEM